MLSRFFHALLATIRRLFSQGSRQCHYIHGSETLPPPLTKEEEAQVLENIRQGAPGAREPLITHNLRLVVYIAKSLKAPAPMWKISFPLAPSG